MEPLTGDDPAEIAGCRLHGRLGAGGMGRVYLAFTPGGRPSLKGFAHNQVWREIVALACRLLVWTPMLALTGTVRRWEPKRFRLRVFAVAGRLARSGRRR